MTGGAKHAVLYDLSPRLDAKLAVWPGDTPFRSWPVARIGEDSSVNLSSLTTTCHLGAHADAPWHSEPTGAGIDAMPLDAYVGACRVVTVANTALVRREHLPAVDWSDTPRLLFKTGVAPPLAGVFASDFAAICPQLADWLAAQGVCLVGTDAPSVDPFTSRELAAHHALLGRGIAVLEGLELTAVPDGVYELIALPLRLVGLDASPVRAVLRAWPSV